MNKLGDNSHGFRNEENFANEVNQGLKKMCLNMKEFIKYVCLNEKIAYSETLEVTARTLNDNSKKEDVVLKIGKNTINVSLKIGTGNSVHQEKCGDFIKYIKSGEFSDTKEYTIDEICEYWQRFIWCDGTLNGKGKKSKRFGVNEYIKKYPDEREKLKSFIKDNEEKLIKHFLFTGANKSNVQYIYHGSPTDGRWISAKEILEYQLKESQNNRGCLPCGKMTIQVWNRALGKNISESSEKKRGQLQVKYGSMEKDFANLMESIGGKIGTFEGDKEEFTFVKLMNGNKNHNFWEKISKENNKNLYAVAVSGMQNSKLSGKKVYTKSDVYIVKSEEIDKKFLQERENLITEKDLKSLKYKKIEKTGVSVKKKGSKNYTIQKFTIETLRKLFEKKETEKEENEINEIIYGLLVYTNDNMLENNEKIAKDLGINYQEYVDKKKKEYKLEKSYNSKELFKKIRSESQNELYELIKNDKNILNAIYTGVGWFDEPYCAKYIYELGELKENIASEDFYITTGSGRSNGDYSIAIKPKKNNNKI